ncbi:cell wall-binding repeat-containing protein [Clostridium cochlearium]|uniref:cell wall-binding repeat-containing protein n=1 Tax=Clostridium cochlearium TaxID=1494 RepID=UPI000BBB8504|nr:cell wall-binding repeat-containing protein [Clostridium cochlearium]
MNHPIMACPTTLNTTRVCGIDSIDIANNVSFITFTTMRPNAIILVNKNEVFDGIVASSLVHFPIDAPILFTDGNILNRKTLWEILRLRPKGYKGIHVIIVGNISDNVVRELNTHGLRTARVAGENHYEIACKIPGIRKDFKNIILISGEDYSEGIMSSYWSAHHGDPILYVEKDTIPSCTLEAIKKMNEINVYIVGSTKTISKSVEKALLKLNNIKNLQRIDGENPYEIAVNFAKYKDPKTEFGWGRNYKEGHAFTFGTLEHPMSTIGGVPLAHMGKHTPLLLIEKDIVPSVVEEYIKSVKPIPPKDMPRPPFMHGFILGDVNNISYTTQVRIESNLSIDNMMMGMS